MRAWRLGGVLVALLLVLAACGGDDDDTATTAGGDPSATSSTAGAAPTTTVADDDDDDGGEVGSIGDMPDECREVFVDYLRAIEPHVEDIDFETATLADLGALGELIESDPALAEFDQRIDDLECPDLSEPDSDEVREELLAIAESEAPGTVPFVEYSIELAASFGGTDDGTGGGDQRRLRGQHRSRPGVHRCRRHHERPHPFRREHRRSSHLGGAVRLPGGAARGVLHPTRRRGIPQRLTPAGEPGWRSPCGRRERPSTGARCASPPGRPKCC